MTLDPITSAQYKSLTDDELEEVLAYANNELAIRKKSFDSTIISFCQNRVGGGPVSMIQLIADLKFIGVKFPANCIAEIYVDDVLRANGGFNFLYDQSGYLMVELDTPVQQTAYISSHTSVNYPSTRYVSKGYITSDNPVATVTTTPTKTKRIEVPCKAPSCGKMNDVGVASCWCCGGKI